MNVINTQLYVTRCFIASNGFRVDVFLARIYRPISVGLLDALLLYSAASVCHQHASTFIIIIIVDLSRTQLQQVKYMKNKYSKCDKVEIQH